MREIEYLMHYLPSLKIETRPCEEKDNFFVILSFNDEKLKKIYSSAQIKISPETEINSNEIFELIDCRCKKQMQR